MSDSKGIEQNSSDVLFQCILFKYQIISGEKVLYYNQITLCQLRPHLGDLYEFILLEFVEVLDS